MINLGSRFVDYGLTGGFFIFVQISVLSWFFPEIAVAWLTGAAKFISESIAVLPDPAHPAFSSILVALAVVSIFFVGLLLDLMGSILVFWEAHIFKRHLDQNEGWFTQFLQRYESYNQGDYERIKTEFIGPSESFRRSAAFLQFWNLDAWRRTYQEMRRGLRVFGSLGSFHRIENFLMAYVLAASGASGLDWLGDQLRLCRTSRAISASLFVLAMEVSWLTFTATSAQPWVWMVMQYAILGVSVFVTFRAYSRFCGTLFSLTYAYLSREQHAVA